jgi:hypothetical protein
MRKSIVVCLMFSLFFVMGSVAECVFEPVKRDMAQVVLIIMSVMCFVAEMIEPKD